jgi:ornithine--oxo-acid transaminase
MYILGKALSGGFYPVSAVVSRREVLDLFTPGSHGSTFGGNPLGCAVARTALQVMQDERLVERAAREGAWLLEQLGALRHPDIVAVRGRGMIVGIELKVKARPYCERLMQLGMLCKETHDTVIRIAPPLNTQREDLELAVRLLREAFEAQ